ncbi:hypothetical protein C6P40_001993 [Pichia californica]|uniref:SGNH hydrolase-type esterase domain-containing protein n=1 Tax=Pichia californica TaxID=460514 RepID=A0A9P6WIZ0_9ASCO|nr:hypothetical protein C6P40_001993 [[Candida] californica]
MSYTDYNTFLMFGDSITEFAFNQFPDPLSDVPQFALGPALQNIYARKLQVLHRGFSGYTSRDALPLIKSILKEEFDKQPESKKIKIAYVFFGTNDARHKGLSTDNNEHIALDVYLKNMELVVNEFTQRKIPLIIITTGYHDQNMWNKSHPQDLLTKDYRSNENNLLYQNEIIARFADRKIDNVFVLPLYSEMEKWAKSVNSEKILVHNDYSELLSDGIHLSGQGYKVLFNSLMDIINQNIKSMSPQFLSYKFPHHSVLDDNTFKHINN